MNEHSYQIKCSILMGSPRKNGNTIQLVKPFMKELESQGAACRLTWLYDRDIRPCVACRVCQKDWSKAGCWQKDDMELIFEEILECDLLILASPIYSWYCTPPVKAVLDRLVYGLNKYYGEEAGPSLWEGKKLALITSSGYRPEKGADLWEEGMKRYCKHSRLKYAGMLAERHINYKTEFMDKEKEQRAIEFAQKVLKQLDQ